MDSLFISRANFAFMEVWMAGPREQAEHRAALILHTQITAGDSGDRVNTIIRHYDLGLASRVKDARSGRSTARSRWESLVLVGSRSRLSLSGFQPTVACRFKKA